MRVLAIANQKGGCGKTTTSINLAAALALLEKKILLLDLDPQGHSTCGLGIKAEAKKFTLYDLLTPREDTRTDISNVWCELSPFFFLVPTYSILGAVEEELALIPSREKKIGELLQSEAVQNADFDYVVMDCAPNMGILTLNALEAADEILIPVEPSFYSLHGLAKISETVHALNQKRSQPLGVHALLTLFNSEAKLAQEVYHEVQKHFQERLFKTVIHEHIELEEAASAGQSIIQFAPHSAAYREYYHLAIELLEREWNRRLPERRLGWDNFLHQKFGPRRVAGGILFQIQSKNARGVEIAGDFNNWVPEPLVRREENGLWQKVIPISQGVYRYKFIIDGEWQMDPYQPVQRINQFGTFDSYLELV